MKKLSIFLLALIGFSLVSYAQCGDELLKKALSDMGSFQYIKDFDIKLPAGQSKTGSMLTVVLNSNTHYQINLVNGAVNSEDVIIQIFDGDKLIGTNFANGKTFNKFQFLCSKTGAYKLHVYCNSGGEACARAVLSLVKQYTSAEMPM